MNSQLRLREWACRFGIGFLLGLSVAPASAQGGEVSLEIGGSALQPPAGVEGELARFFSGGIRATRFWANGSGVFASLLGGRALEEGQGGDFLSGTLEGVLWWEMGAGWSLGLEGKGFGFEVQEPFPYRAFGTEGGPGVRFSSRNLLAKLQGAVGTGWSKTRLILDQGDQVVEDELWRYGATAEVLTGNARLMAGVSAGIHESLGGSYQSGGLRLIAGFGGPALELRVDSWNTPAGTETTGGLAFVLPFGGWTVRGVAGRTEPDPLTLTEPGGGGGGILIGRRLVGMDPIPPRKPPLHEVLAVSDGVATVRVRLEDQEGAQGIVLMGDFTQWKPVAMNQSDEGWEVEVLIPPGTHHFGFLVDGTWFLPEDAPDVVPDEWGRENATLVIERNDPRATYQSEPRREL